ncbi:hypothetical protein GCM10007301_21590 [Azorhizobium oxalatiphilum]|uniref:YcxB-like protein domain-containing protein n=1 Tax=Azorhizobium oxalatiphilum TaxID=980631 RepID=A0A917BWP6_9HYPH|nr:hypothetical protein [Azorhizobium oxalatiphilum]GGF61577.1 hypothetical protein GCM10007301_21590 [Azorhizobium oxalatiphilum]
MSSEPPAKPEPGQTEPGQTETDVSATPASPDAPPIAFAYDFDATQKDDFQLGRQHQAYENEQWLLGEGKWRRYWRKAIFDNAGHAALSGACVYALGIWALPVIGGSADGLWVFLPLPLAMLDIWLVLRFTGNGLNRAYQDSCFASLLWFEQTYAGPRHVTIGPEGMRCRTRTDDVFLGWRRYLLAVDQPEHLVLVFHGEVLAIPHAALPQPGRDVALQINAWAGALIEREDKEKAAADPAAP